MIGFLPLQILIFQMLHNNADVHWCSYFELELPVVQSVLINPWIRSLSKIPCMYDRHCNTAHTCNSSYCWKVLKNILAFVVFLLSLGTQSHNQVKREFTSAVLLDIIPHGHCTCSNLLWSGFVNKWQINLTELIW